MECRNPVRPGHGAVDIARGFAPLTLVSMLLVMASSLLSAQDLPPVTLGWEPPQIDSLVAEEYGIAGLMEDHGRDGVNQSVVMVIF